MSVRQEIHIRDMRPGEEETLWALFSTTIHRVNARDYSAAQLEAWAPTTRTEADVRAWRQRMQNVKPFIASIDGSVAGFSDLQRDGLVDFMFVAADFQGMGVAGCLMREIESRARADGIERLYAHVSETARAFFERSGFRVEASQAPLVRGVRLRNYLMRRQLA